MNVVALACGQGLGAGQGREALIAYGVATGPAGLTTPRKIVLCRNAIVTVTSRAFAGPSVSAEMPIV